ncbi:plant cysteine oxidase 3 [Impatiens glandulifera]|uniref:plant cysteine oxidase 3 n=1 Tax=Impatiens glandulifera TaxID=253017 RepID=UPI001FB11293|nr:plant cysteine oxidase 3 [Impatiens glandulifera]
MYGIKFLNMVKKAFPCLSSPSSFYSTSPSSSDSPIQALFDLTVSTFTPSTSPTSPQSIQKLSSVLDNIVPADVGLQEESEEDDRGHGFFGFNQLNRVARWAQPLTYIDIHESDSFTMCIFCFPTSSVIPLHDHPGMTVLSKVLYGTMHVKAYDWVEPAFVRRNLGPNHSEVRLAKLSVDKVLTAPCETSVLYPNSGGNVHCFTAVTPCAVIDILAPPYNEVAGRKCSYYRDHPYSTSSFGKSIKQIEGKEDEYAWLETIGTPDDLYMRHGEYKGPDIVVHG